VQKGTVVTGALVNASAAVTFLAVPSDAVCLYLAFFSILIIGLVMLFVRGDWQKAQGLDKLLLFGPIFYAMSVATFGTEHFTAAVPISSIIPAWIPFHLFWVYFLGVCFIAAALSLVTKIGDRYASALLALTFFLFVGLMHAPSAIQAPQNRTAFLVAFRETAFSGGALALAAALNSRWPEHIRRILKTVARYFVCIPVLLFSYEQFTHGKYVAGVPLERLTPDYIPGHSLWTYLGAVVYALAGLLLFANIKTRAAATWLGATVLLIELMVYLPIGIVDRASVNNGANYVADTLMFCGSVLLLAVAMPRERQTADST
jgi:uncharacterized membrane protein